MGASMSGGDEEGGVVADINVTPLVDVVLVLLIVFMITVPDVVGSAQIKVDLPELLSGAGASLGGPEQLPIDIHVKLDENGEVAMYLGERRVALAEIDSFVNSLGPNRSETTVRVAADRGIPYGNVVQVMDLLGAAGMTKLSLNTKNLGG